MEQMIKPTISSLKLKLTRLELILASGIPDDYFEKDEADQIITEAFREIRQLENQLHNQSNR